MNTSNIDIDFHKSKKDINQLLLELTNEVKTIKSQINDIYCKITSTSNLEYSCAWI